MHSIGTLIIGGGIAGASLACSLAELQAGRDVALVDVDLYGRLNSSELNGGGVRCTFKEPVNVRLSLHSTRYYLKHAGTVDFRQRGYLWLYDEELWAEARSFLPTVRQFGLPVEELTPRGLSERFPLLGDVSDLAGATLTPFDGRLNPHRLRIHYLNQAEAGGVQVMDRWQVVGIEGERPPYTVRLHRVSPRQIKKTLTDGVAKGYKSKADGELTISCQRIVNCAGPWAGEIATLYGRKSYVTPHPRQVFLLRHPEVNLEPLPFFIDYPQDIYFRYYERDRKPCTLVSWSDPGEPDRIDFSYHSEGYYREHVRPRLARRIPQLASAELVGGWVGHYELSPDKGAIVGPVPGRENLFNYNGLSAHGVMQSRALGEAMAHLLVDGKWPDELNLDELAESRFEAARSLVEPMYV